MHTHPLPSSSFVLEPSLISSRKYNSTSSLCVPLCSVYESDHSCGEQGQPDGPAYPTELVLSASRAFPNSHTLPQNLHERIAIFLIKPTSSYVPVLMKLKLFNCVWGFVYAVPQQ